MLGQFLYTLPSVSPLDSIHGYLHFQQLHFLPGDTQESSRLIPWLQCCTALGLPNITFFT